MTTQSDEAAEKAVPDLVLIKGANAEASAHTRARPSVARLTDGSAALARHWGRLAKQTWDCLWENSVTEQHPASIAALRGYIHSAAWVPGDVPLLEFLGRAYGYLIALPVSAVLYALAWLVQRPGRAVLATLVAVIVWLTGT